MIAATIARPELTGVRPGLRFGLIDHALAPLRDTLAVTSPDAYAQLRRDLSVVVSAEALFTLTDLCGLPPDQAIASASTTARTLTTATLTTASRTTGTAAATLIIGKDRGCSCDQDPSQ